MENSEVDSSEIRAIAVSEGPGSYTGLRIGSSVSKALAYAWQVPLLPVPTLDILIQQVYTSSLRLDTLLVPMIDARRMEVYMKISDLKLRDIWSTKALVVDVNSFSGFHDYHLLMVGNGAEKVYNLVDHPSKKYINVLPDASNMGSLAYKYLNEGHGIDPAYFEPIYLKEFQTKKSKDLLRP